MGAKKKDFSNGEIPGLTYDSIQLRSQIWITCIFIKQVESAM